jgi:hypothetical protein
MIKRFCDICKEEITTENRIDGDRMKTELRCASNIKDAQDSILKVEVMTSHNQVTNAGDFCKYCVLKALYKLDDRPKEAT